MDRPIRLLVMDDQEDIVTLIRITAEIDGRFEVVGAVGDGAAAVELSRRLHPDVVVLDHMVDAQTDAAVTPPLVLSGRAAVVELRAALPDVFIVMYSGMTPTEDDEQAVDLYLLKGEVDPASMLDRIAASLPGGPARRPPAGS